MILTNKRIFILIETGRIRKKVISSVLLPDIHTVNTKKPLIGKEKLTLSVDLGTQKPEMMEFEIEDASNWANTICGQMK